jgi:hypothetical protein
MDKNNLYYKLFLPGLIIGVIILLIKSPSTFIFWMNYYLHKYFGIKKGK